MWLPCSRLTPDVRHANRDARMRRIEFEADYEGQTAVYLVKADKQNVKAPRELGISNHPELNRKRSPWDKISIQTVV